MTRFGNLNTFMPAGDNLWQHRRITFERKENEYDKRSFCVVIFSDFKEGLNPEKCLQRL